LVWVTGWLHLLFFGRINSGTVSAVAVGCTVAVAWTCLGLLQRWENETSWIDKLGRLTGVAAILIGLFAVVALGI
jgi:hypothetical protein